MEFFPAVDKKDFKVISQLAHAIWTEHYVPIEGKAQIDYMLNKFQSADAVSKQINDEGYLYYIIRDGDENIGYIGIQPRNGELFLSKIYVKSSERGKGYGRKAMFFIEDRVKEMQLNKITLTVNKKNVHSIKAYKKMGFICVDSIIQDIGNGFVMDDYKMEKVIF